jgi:cytoskeleton-associated protein 5
VAVLLARLVDERLPKLPEGDALLKALNVLMLKTLDNSERTAAFSALLALLLEPHLQARWASGLCLLWPLQCAA